MSPPPPPNHAAAVLLAAGRSERMKGATAKPFLEIGGRTVLELACAAFDAATVIKEIVLVGRADDLGRLEELARSGPHGSKVTRCVAGGEERTDSVRAGVRAVSSAAEVILVHDVARPLVRPERIESAAAAAERDGAALLAVRVRDTIKSSSDGRLAERTLERAELWAAHTPQAFRARELRTVLERAEADGFHPTDDAALWERYIGPVALVEDDPENIKLTTPSDLVVAEAILRARITEGT